MLTKVFGIISYLPNQEPDRTKRIQRFNNMLDKLHSLWPEVPFLIIAQNWKDFNITYPATIYRYEKLGILKARKTLRNHFLETNFDYLIMMDDDAIIKCEDGSAYMKQIDNHPNQVGFFRHTQCPLMLLAISKHIYSKIDMPDIDPEKDEGFEDDIFVANCMNKFPNSWFDIKHDGIEEISFKYKGEDSVPSTWANLKERDWKKLIQNTHDIVNSLNKNQYISNISSNSNDIDLIVPYVDSMDPEWIALYNKFNKEKQINEETNGISRFRGQGEFFKYFFRCVNRNLSWIHNLFLIVQSESQVPSWINRNTVKIILHKDFIPEEYLPTFNSTCIEMFLWNIQELGEKFIYANDDLLVNNPLDSIDFFKDDLIRTNTSLTGDLQSMFGHHKVNCYSLIYNQPKEEIFKQGKVISVSHLIRPYLKSEMKKCFDEYKIDILNSISKFREEKNLNIFLFDHYLIKHNKQFYREHILGRCINSNSSDGWITEVLNSSQINIVCIQDTDYSIDIYKNIVLKIYFIEHYTKKSKYEK